MSRERLRHITGHKLAMAIKNYLQAIDKVTVPAQHTVELGQGEVTLNDDDKGGVLTVAFEFMPLPQGEPGEYEE